MPLLSGQQFKQLVEAILDGFDQSSLQQLLLYDLNVQLNHIAGDGPFRQTVFQVVQWAGGQGLIPDLLTALSKARPNNPVVQKAAADLRSSLGLPAPAAAPPPPAPAPPPPPLHQYPRAGMVPPDRVPLSFIPVFSQLYPTSDAVFRAASAANQLRRSADPDDPDVRAIDLADVQNPAVVGANAVWTNILLQACRQGPRMVAALLLSAPSDAFGADRDRFLNDLAKAT
ncbi:MAG TPA: effector-associated domain EAD1-containing protein [Gemmataceae bacterium]|jgi:hypothetical protein